MRIRLRTGPAALFGALLVAALIAFLPMRLVLGASGVDAAGLSAREVTGSVWDARLIEARFGTLALGDLDAHLSPLALLVGKARIAVDGGARPLSGAIGVSRHSSGIDDVTAVLPTSGVFAPLPVTSLSLADVTVHFRDGACDKAEGRVTATMGGDAGGVALPASVAGTPRCDAAALLLPLASQAGTETVTLRITGDGRYTATFALRSPDPSIAPRLAAAGFVAGADGYRLSVEGRF